MKTKKEMTPNQQVQAAKRDFTKDAGLCQPHLAHSSVWKQAKAGAVRNALWTLSW